MDVQTFDQARTFIYRDIEREIALAYSSERRWWRCLLRVRRVPAGGGNFLAALGLLCYTEFAGKLRYNVIANGREISSKNFNQFFDDLGPTYAGFRASGVNVYDIFRCGLAHEYFVKRNCDIYMMSGTAPAAIGLRPNGRFWFVVEKYLADFRAAFDRLRADLFP